MDEMRALAVATVIDQGMPFIIMWAVVITILTLLALVRTFLPNK
jgi:hypothetical protein